MARAFASASSEYLEIDSAVFTDYPFTMACWFNVTNTTSNHILICVGDKDQSDYITLIQAAGGLGGDPLRAFSHDYGSASVQDARTSTGFSANTWHHACGTWGGVSNRRAYLDGGGEITDTDTVGAMANHDRTSIGRAGDSSPGGYTDGQIAEAAIWNAVLGDAEVASLAAGYAPPFVRPQNLIFYIPLVRDNDKDIIQGRSLTPFNTPTIAAHPRIIYPGTRRIGLTAAAAVETITLDKWYQDVSRPQDDVLEVVNY